MKNKNAGFTLIEVLVAITLVAIIAIGIIPAFAAQFKMTLDTKNLTTSAFDSQGEFEQAISELKQALVDPLIDENAIDGVTATTKSIFGRTMTVYKISKLYTENENKSFLAFLSKKLAEMEVRQMLVATGVRIEVSNETVHELADMKKTPKPTLIGKVDTNTDPNWYANLYKWYVSNEGNPDPVWPEDYERLTFTGVTPPNLNDLTKEVNRYIVFTVTPVDIHGFRGTEVRSSNEVYVLGEEWRSGVFAWVDKNANASYYGEDDVMIAKINDYKWHLLDGFDGAETFLDPENPSDTLYPSDGSLYVPMGIDRAAGDRVGPIDVAGNDILDWKVDKSIHLATDINVTNNTDIKMEARDGNVILYQYIQLDPNTGNAVFVNGKPVMIDYGPELSAPGGSITLKTSGKGDISLQKYTDLDAGNTITLQPYGKITAVNSTIAAKGSVYLDTTKGTAFPSNRDIDIKNTSFTLTPNSSTNRTISVESLNGLSIVGSTFIGNTGAASKITLSADDGMDLSEVNFANAVIEINDKAKFKGGGWNTESTLKVADGKLLTFGSGNTKVDNSGNLSLGNTGAVDFINSMSANIMNPLLITLGKGNSDNEVTVSTNYGRNIGYADSSSYETISVNGDYQNMGSGQTNMKYAVTKLDGNGSPSIACAFDGSSKLGISASGTGPISAYYELNIKDKYVEDIYGSIKFRVYAAEGETPSVYIIGSTIPIHNVTFYNNDGTGQIYTTKTAYEGNPVSVFPSEPERAKYIFTGWNTMADGTGSAFNAATIVTEGISVYAQWSRIPIILYTVDFNSNGGTTGAVPSSMQVENGDPIGSLPQPPTRSGFTFNGWNTQPGGGGAVINANTIVTGHMTAYAQWTNSKKTYAQINIGEYIYIKNNSNNNVLFQKISADKLLARVTIQSNGNNNMNWNIAWNLAKVYLNGFPSAWNGWNWITASDLVDGTTLNTLDRSNIRDINQNWWGGETPGNSARAYRVDNEGYIDERNKANNQYRCRPYISISNTDHLYVTSGTGTLSDPYYLTME